MPNQQSLTGTGMILMAAVLWGTTGTTQALAPAEAQPLAVGAVRLAVAGAALVFLAVRKGGLGPINSWPPRATLGAAASVAAYQPLFFQAVDRTGVAVGTVVAIGSAPVLAGLLSWLIHRERMNRYWALATTLAVAGCGLLFAARGPLVVDSLGLVMALGAGLAYASYAVVSKGLLAAKPPDVAMAGIFIVATLLLAPLLFQFDLGWLREPRGWLAALHLGVFATAAAYALFARGLQIVPVATAVSLSLAEPLTASLLGLTLLQERLSPLAGAGLATLLLGLILLTRSPAPKNGPGNRG